MEFECGKISLGSLIGHAIRQLERMHEESAVNTDPAARQNQGRTVAPIRPHESYVEGYIQYATLSANRPNTVRVSTSSYTLGIDFPVPVLLGAPPAKVTQSKPPQPKRELGRKIDLTEDDDGK
jgi:hypothetical protein